MPRRLRAVHGATFVILVAAGACASTPAPIWTRPGLETHVRPEMGPPQPGDAAPDFDLPRVDGSRYRLADRRGRWVVLHFTTTWCPFCDEEVEHLDRLAKRFENANVDVLLVDVLEEPDHWNAYLEGRLPERALVSLVDADGTAARRFAPPRALPSFEERANVVLASSLIIDPHGVVRFFLLADSQAFDPTLTPVAAELERLLAEEGAGTNTARLAPDTAAPPGPARAAEDDVLPPERVVTVHVESPTATSVGVRGELTITLVIEPGYHVMSNAPSKPNYIPTELTLRAEGIRFDAPVFPPPVMFQLSDDTIETFQGRAVVRVPFVVDDAPTAGTRSVQGKVQYQACTIGACLFPYEKPFSLELPIHRPSSNNHRAAEPGRRPRDPRRRGHRSRGWIHSSWSARSSLGSAPRLRVVERASRWRAVWLKPRAGASWCTGLRQGQSLRSETADRAWCDNGSAAPGQRS